MSSKTIQPRGAIDSPTSYIDGGVFQHHEQFVPHVLEFLR
jgi:hypothetical protein